MVRRLLSVLLVVTIAITSLDMTAYAVEMEKDESAYTQEVEMADEVVHMDGVWIAEDMELTKAVEIVEETQTSERIQEESQNQTALEGTDEANSEQSLIEVTEENVEKEEIENIQKANDDNQNKAGEEIGDQASEVEERDGNTEDASDLLQTQTEETETVDVDVAASYERISRVSRDDGTWLFPLGKSYWNSFSDWAGCPGYGKCSFCGKVHSSWGDDAHTGQSYGHNGFDIGASIGTSVLAAASGTVAYTSTGNNGGRGNFIVIEHPISGIDFSYYSYYQHLNSISVSKGASVKAGDTIAKSGNSGIGTGAHLHFGIVIAKKGTNIGSRLYEIECKGWVTGSENKEGRILVNPSTKQQGMPTGSSEVIPPLAYHSGSVTYTFDKSKVTIGSATPTGESKLQITGQKTPPNLNLGQRWSCEGTISSNYTINQVGGYILKSDNSTSVYSKVINPNATSYSLKNGAIDIALLFNELPVGTYYYRITAKDSSGKSLTLINAKFTVGNPTPAPCSFSGKITSPANGSTIEISRISVQATATDTYAINSFKISLVAGTYNKTVTANATKSGNSYVCSYDMDLPSYTTYTVTVDAVCANGATHRIGANTVTYKKKECSFSGKINAPADNAVVATSTINIQATAADTYAIKNFVIKLFWNNTQKTETVAASTSGNSYVCNYNLSLPTQARYKAEIYAACANGATHKIGERSFIYDTTPPKPQDLKVYEDKGDFWYTVSVSENIGIANSWIILKDNAGTEKRLECGKDKNTFTGIWSDIRGLKTYGKYTITFYAQDYAGNVGYATLQNVVIAEVSDTYDGKVYMTVDEEKEISISVNTLFKTEGKALTQKTDTGMKVETKAMNPGSYICKFEWIAKNNAFSTDHDYSIFVYVVPQTPRINQISNAVKGYDIITYEPVTYAKTYELYRKNADTDDDYQLWEEFKDNKSHSIVVEHTDKSAAYLYRLRVKAEETTDIQTNEKYYPTSAFSDDAYSEKQEESGDDIESSTESDPSLENPDITDGLYISGLEAKTYTGSAIKQDIKVYYNKTLLKEGTDYTLSYKNNINVGNAVLIIKAKSNLTGSVTKNFEIKPKEITDTDVIIEDAVYIYDNKTHKKAPKVTYKGKTLKEKKDFEVSSYGGGDYTATGTYTAKIKGIGNFKGTFENAKIIIVDKNKNISKATIAKIPAQEYQNGVRVELSDELLKVTLAKTELKKDVDYTVSYVNNIHQGKATLIINGKGEYVGTKKVNFMIKSLPIELTEDMIVNKGSINSVQIKKNGVMPRPWLVSNNNTLVQGKDYVLSYKNNKKKGIGIVIIKGKGSYTGSFEMPFQITSKALTSSDITIRVPNVPYTGKPNKYQSIPVITDSDGGVLVKDKDYTIEVYQTGEAVLDKESNPEEGTEITITIKGKGSYTGTVKATYALEGISFAKAVIKVAPKSYTGKLVTIGTADIVSATIKTGKTKNSLKFGKDYEIISYSNNLKKGTATVTFRGIGAYAGEKTVKFKIMPTTISNKNECAVDMHIDLVGEP